MSPLENLVFPEQIQQSAFQEVLESLDHVSAEFVSREEFEGKRWEFLQASGERDKFWQFYILFLPEDLQVWETLEIIDTLSQKFEITNYAPVENLLSYTKIAIATILRESTEKDSEEIQNVILNELQKKYHISDAFREKIRSHTIWVNTSSKDFIRAIREKRGENTKSDEVPSSTKLWETWDSHISEEILSHIFGNEFGLTFFRKWVNMLRLWMMTITQREQEALKEKRKSLKTGEEIDIHKSTETLDEQERLLREKIGIEELKADLNAARESGNKRKVTRLEKRATEKILQTLYEYPYQLTSNDYGYEPAEILRHKEIYCVGFALLWHSFLSELWIEHQWIGMPFHSALEVNLWWVSYYFDPSETKRLYKIYYGKQIWSYREMVLKRFWIPILRKLFIADNPEKILFSQILNNKWTTLHKLWRYEEAIQAYDTALKLNPQDAEAYHNKWIALRRIWKHNLAELYFFVSKKLKWKNPWHWSENIEAMRGLDALLEQKNFEGVRQYLLEFEAKGK